MKWIPALLLLGVVHPLFVTERANALDIPIQVQELTPTNVPSHARALQVVRAGVPLPPEEQIQSVDELGFTGSSAAQFRVLQRDPETQDIRWVLVRFYGEPSGSGYAVTRGGGDFGAADLATDTGQQIVIDTGAATFTIGKQGFRFLDHVERQGQVVLPNGLRGLVVKANGDHYTSGNDALSEVVLEDNGPLETVVHARGHLRNTSGDAHFAYTARLTFQRGSATCRAAITIRNAELASLSTKKFDAAWVEFPTTFEGSREIRFGTAAGDVIDTISHGSEAHLLQGDNEFMRNGRTVRILSELTSAEGLEIEVDGVTHSSLGDMDAYSRGWMTLADATQRVSVGMRDFAAQFPGGFVVDDDILRMELFSSNNPTDDIWFSWGAHETREFLLRFGDPADDPEDFHYALNYPLLGRCSFEHYRDTGAVYGATELVSVAEQQDFWAQQGIAWDLPELGEDDIEYFRQWSFRTTGGGNQFDKDFNALVDWIRTGSAGFFVRSRIGTLWKADQSIYHSDDFDYGDRERAISDVDVSQPDSFHGKGAGSIFDDEHPHWVSMPLYYWLTGDERIRASIEDYIEYRRYKGGHPYYGALKGGALNHMRIWSRAFRDVALAYEVIQRPRYFDDLRLMAQTLVDTVEVDGSRGRNLDRGYFFFGEEDDPYRYIHLFFLTEMQPIGIREGMRVLHSDDPLKEELRDYLAGLAWFTLQEAQISDTAIGYPYGYDSAVPNPQEGDRGDQTGIVLSHGYRMSGEPRFANRARDLAWRVVVDANEQRASDLSTHIRISEWNDRHQHGVALLTPTATDNGDGTWTLQWTVPDDAVSYIIKYGDRPMVENLMFDQLERTYEHDPATHMNFWAAANMRDEPQPDPAGSQQSWTTPVLPAGPHHFAVKVMLSSAPALRPQTQDDLGQLDEDTSVLLDVAANDSDADGSLDPASMRIETHPTFGDAVVDPSTGAITYTPHENFHGNDPFTYSIADDEGQRSAPATVAIEVAPVNDAPVAFPDYFAADPGEEITLDVLQNDTDVDSPDLSIKELDAAAQAAGLQLGVDRKELYYVAPGKKTGPVQFSYVVEDDFGAVDTAAVYVEMLTVAVELSDLTARNTFKGVVVEARLATDEAIEAFGVLRSRNGGEFELLPGTAEMTEDSRLRYVDTSSGLADGDVLVYRFEVRKPGGERRLLGAQVQVLYSAPGPRAYMLEQSRPNPFNPMTTITFTLAGTAHTTLTIYDVMGRQVDMLVNEPMVPGIYSVTWDGTDRRGRRVASGTYFYRLLSGSYARTRSMRLVK